MNLNDESSKTLFTFKNMAVVVLSLLLALFITAWYNKVQSDKEKDALILSANKEMVIYKDKYGREVARTEQLKVENANTYLQLKFTDSLNLELQKLVKDNKGRISDNGSATVIESEGKIDKKTPTVVTPTVVNTPNDTEYMDNLPSYSTKYKDAWVDYNIEADKDSIKLNLKYIDKYSIVLGKEKDTSLSLIPRLFSKKIDYAWVTTESPYSKIKKTKTLKVTVPPEPKLSLGVQAGYGFGGKDLQPAPYVGIGVSYRILSLGL